jgi:hypothetical protein
VNGIDSVRDEDEKWLYQRINRAKLAPQGICVLNSNGQVLTWVQMFDSNQSVLDFLDHARKRFAENAHAKQPVITEQYMRFPSDKANDFRDDSRLPVIGDGHPKGKTCLAKYAKGKMPHGTTRAQLVGRALDDRGQPLADIVNQEHYVEDQFTVTPELQAAMAKAFATAGKGSVQIPSELAKLCATHAHLGHIDVRPLFGVDNHQNKGEWKRCQFWAEMVEAGQETTLWRIEGQSEVVSEVTINGRGVHDVKLAWDGFIEMKGTRLAQLLLSARGREKLQFAKDDHPLKKEKTQEVAFLPAGRPIDLETAVRYGIIGVPAVEAQSDAADQAGAPVSSQVPDEARRQLIEAFGPPFLVFRDKVQEELDLSDSQKQKLQERLQDTIQDAMEFFEKIKDLEPEEREKEHRAYRQKAQEKLAAFLKETLKEEQRNRLRQLELQQEGVFALFSQPKLMAKLEITNSQRMRLMAVIEEMQNRIQPLVREAQASGKPEAIRPKVMKIRKEHEGRIELVLSNAQKSQWKKMLGKPFDLGD